MLVFSCILLVFGICIKQMPDTYTILDITISNEGVPQISLVTQEALSDRLLEKEMTASLEVAWQQDWCETGKYLFLPGCVDLTQVYVRMSCEGGGEVTLDRIPLDGNATLCVGALSEGEHVLGIDKEEFVFHLVKGSPIASLWIDTEESMDYIHEYIEHTTAGKLKLLWADGSIAYEGAVDSFKGRGNSSWTTAKRSYGLKLPVSASLLGMSPGTSWTLSGGVLDATGLRNKLFYDMAEACGLQNAVEAEWVDLYINGSYYGCYLLTEKITIGQGRLDIGDLEGETESINESGLDSYAPYADTLAGMQLWGRSIANNPSDITGGYLLEIEKYDQRFQAEPSRFVTTNAQPFVIKSPEYASAEQVQYIASFVQEFEEALYAEEGYNTSGGYYLDYIDLESFVARHLIDEISKNIDVGYSSHFIYKPRGENKLYAGPVWDYDTALGNNGGWGDSAILKSPEGMLANSTGWGEQLWNKPEFRELSKEMFQERFLPYLMELSENGLQRYVQDIHASMAMEHVYIGRTNLEEEIVLLDDFLQKRTIYLEKELAID